MAVAMPSSPWPIGLGGTGVPCLRVSSRFGWRINPVTHEKQFHEGVDLPMPLGTPVLAVAPAVVARVELDHPVKGTNVWIKLAGGWSVFYLHLSRALVEAGQAVRSGQVLGLSGSSGRSTGPHLHLGIIDPHGVPVDPVPLLPRGTVCP